MPSEKEETPTVSTYKEEAVDAFRAEVFSRGFGTKLPGSTVRRGLNAAEPYIAKHYEEKARRDLEALVFGDAIKRGVLYRQQNEDGKWSSWQVAELGIPSLLVKGQDRDDYEVEQVLSVDSLRAALASQETEHG